MKLGRRKFFGLAAGAAVGGKKVATDVLADLSNIPTPMPGSLGPIGAAQALGGGANLSHLQGQAAKMAALRTIGVPPIVREMMRQWSGQQQANYDDINSLVSVSVSAKKRMIRERMEEQMFSDWLEGPARSLKREMLSKEFGFSI